MPASRPWKSGVSSTIHEASPELSALMSRLRYVSSRSMPNWAICSGFLVNCFRTTNPLLRHHRRRTTAIDPSRRSTHNTHSPCVLLLSSVAVAAMPLWASSTSECHDARPGGQLDAGFPGRQCWDALAAFYNSGRAQMLMDVNAGTSVAGATWVSPLRHDRGGSWG